jgi:hypothetical protein
MEENTITNIYKKTEKFLKSYKTIKKIIFRMTFRSLVVHVLIAFAGVVSCFYIIVQSVDETRDKYTAYVTKPIPAFILGIAALMSCFIPFSVPRQLLTENEVEMGEVNGSKQNKNVVTRTFRWDIWGMLFGLAFIFYGIGDIFLSQYGTPKETPHREREKSVVGIGREEEKLRQFNSTTQSSSFNGISSETEDDNIKFGMLGIAMFSVGHIFVILALCLPRELRLRRPLWSVRCLIVYAIIGVISWVIFVVIACKHCGASFVMAMFVATYAILLIAVMYRSTDVYFSQQTTRSLLLVIGTHAFFVSDCIVGFKMLCPLHINPSAYYPIVMGIYYLALILQCVGITRYGLDAYAAATLYKVVQQN